MIQIVEACNREFPIPSPAAADGLTDEQLLEAVTGHVDCCRSRLGWDRSALVNSAMSPELAAVCNTRSFDSEYFDRGFMSIDGATWDWIRAYVPDYRMIGADEFADIAVDALAAYDALQASIDWANAVDDETRELFYATFEPFDLRVEATGTTWDSMEALRGAFTRKHLSAMRMTW